MRYTYSLNLISGLGIVGRFIIALIILTVLKNTNKNDAEIARGVRLLVFFGVVTALIILMLIILWFVLFGAAFTLPFFGHIYY